MAKRARSSKRPASTNPFQAITEMGKPAFASIGGGWFTMGTALGHEDEGPPHRV